MRRLVKAPPRLIDYVVCHELAHLRQVQDDTHEPARNIAAEQPVPVLAEHRGVPDRVVSRETDEPPEQQIVVELLHQLSFRANCKKCLQQEGSQQALRRDRRSSFARIKSAEGRRQLPQRFVHDLADGSQWMVCRNPRFQRNVTEKNFRSLIFTGIATNVCVESTLRDSFFLEYFSVVLHDATHHAGPAFIQEASLYNIEKFFGWVSSVEEFRTALQANINPTLTMKGDS